MYTNNFLIPTKILYLRRSIYSAQIVEAKEPSLSNECWNFEMEDSILNNSSSVEDLLTHIGDIMIKS